MKKIIYSLLVICLIAGCKSNKEKKSSDLIFETLKYEEKIKVTDIPNTELRASIPVVKGESQAAKSINNKVFETVKPIIAQEGDGSSTYDELFKGFITNYEDFYREFIIDFPDYKVGWEAIIEGSVNYDSPDIVNIKIESYTFMGGAHGNTYTTSLIFNPKNGNELNINNIIKDTNSLSKLAEKKFREQFHIPADQPINSTGFMFDNNKFVLPQNYFITKNGLLLFYNTYEIAAYVEGSKEILIPYDEIKDNLLIKLN